MSREASLIRTLVLSVGLALAVSADRADQGVLVRL